MAYMRGEWYVYSSGDSMQIYGNGDSIAIPMDTFDELVAMRWARLTEDERRETIERAAAKHRGNFGADAVASLVGLPTVLEYVQRLATEGQE